MKNDLILSFLHSAYLKGDLPKEGLSDKVQELIRTVNLPVHEDKKTALAKNFISYLESVISGLDSIPENYDFASTADKRKVLEAIFDSETYLHSMLSGRYMHLTTTQIWSEVRDLLAKLNPNLEIITVESAAPVTSKTKIEIRKKFSNSFVVFKVDRDVLGGIVIQTPTGLIDASWRGKIMGLTELV